MHGHDDRELIPSNSITKNLALLLKTLGCQSGVRGRNLLHEALVPRGVLARSISVGLDHWPDTLEQMGELSELCTIDGALDRASCRAGTATKRNAAALLNVCTASERDVGRAS